MLTQDTLKGGETSGTLVKGVLAILSLTQELVPGILVTVTEGTKELADLLNFSVCLSICLRVVP